MVNRRRDLLRVRVDLIGVTPPIWREILVPARYSFWDLHVAIQDAMGWMDSHLHEFEIKGPMRGRAVRIGIPDDEGWGGSEACLPGWEVAVLDHLPGKGAEARYVYDFGDCWEHRVRLRGIEPRTTGQRYPQCVGGARACPPEDCGGPPGYARLLETLADPSDPEHEDFLEWVPEDWDSEAFDPTKVHFDSPKRRFDYAFGDFEDDPE